MLSDLNITEIAAIEEKADENIALAKLHAEETSKTWQQVEDELEDYEQESQRSDYYYKRLTTDGKSYKLGEIEAHTVPGRVFDSPISVRTDPSSQM